MMKKKSWGVFLCAVLLIALSVFAIACNRDPDNDPDNDPDTTTYTVTVEGGTGGGEFEEGAQCAVTATVPTGKGFVNWTVDGEEVSKSITYRFNVTKNVTLVANFGDIYTVTVVGGTIKPSNGKVTQGNTAEVTSAPPVGYRLASWQIDGEVVSTEDPYTFAPTSDVTITATFEPKPAYAITVEGGFGSGTYYEGDPVVAIGNAEGKQFVQWNVDGEKVSEDQVYVFDAAEAVTVTAVYDDTKTAFDDPTEFVFFPEAPSDGGINLAMDRALRNPPGTGTNQGKSVFVDADFAGGASIDYVLVFAYESQEPDAEPVGYFKYYQNTVTSLVDDSISYTQTQEWSIGGNYYIFGADFASFLSQAWGSNYSNTTQYYFRSQLIAKKDSDFANSVLSGVTSSYFVELLGDFNLITLVNCTAPGGRYPDGQAHTVGVMYEGSVTITATVPEGAVVLSIKWFKDEVEIEGETELEYTFTPDAPCLIEAVVEIEGGEESPAE